MKILSAWNFGDFCGMFLSSKHSEEALLWERCSSSFSIWTSIYKTAILYSSFFALCLACGCQIVTRWKTFQSRVWCGYTQTLLFVYSRQNAVMYCFEFMIPTLTLGVHALTWLFWARLSRTGKHISVWHKETNLAENLAAAALIPGVMEQSVALITSCSKPHPSSPLPKWQWRVALLYLDTQSNIDISDFLKMSNF